MDFALDDDQHAVQDAARAFAQASVSETRAGMNERTPMEKRKPEFGAR